MSYSYEYPRPSVTVDATLFGYSSSGLSVLLIFRNDDPYKDCWALPGGFVEVSDEPNQGESLEDAVRRELQEETGAEIDYLEQLYTFGTPGRDPRGRVISVAYYALVRQEEHKIQAGSDASEAKWFQVDERLMGLLEDNTAALAFDHHRILKMAIQRLQSKTRYAPVGFNLLDEEFTIPDLQRVYEALLFRKLDRSNFRKKMVSAGFLEESNLRKDGNRHVQLYRFNKAAYDAATERGFSFEPKYKREK